MTAPRSLVTPARSLAGLALAGLALAGLAPALAAPGAGGAGTGPAVRRSGMPAPTSGSSLLDASLQASTLSAGAEATYAITFRTTRPMAAGSTSITVALPAGSTASGSACGRGGAEDVVTDDDSEISRCAVARRSGSSLVLREPLAIAAGGVVSLLLRGIRTPPAAGSPSTVGSSDVAVELSASSAGAAVRLPLALRRPTAVTNTSLQLSSYSAGARGVTYSITFVAPDRFTAGSTIVVSAPAGTAFPEAGCGAYVMLDDTAASGGGCGSPPTLRNGGSSFTLPAPPSVPGDEISLVVRGVINRPVAGPARLQVDTSSDPAPISLDYRIVPPQSVADAAMKRSSTAPGARNVTWSIAFRSPGRLTGFGSPSGDSTVTVVAPPGTVFPRFTGCGPSYTFVDPLDGIDSCVAGATLSGGGSRLVLRPPAGETSPGALVSLVVEQVRNPSAGSSRAGNPSAGSPSAGSPSAGSPSAGSSVRLETSSAPAVAALPLSPTPSPSPSLQLDSTSAAASEVSYAATFALPAALRVPVCGQDVARIVLAAAPGTVFPASGGEELVDLSSGAETALQPCPGGGAPSRPDVAALAMPAGSPSFTTGAGDEVAVVARAVASAPSPGAHRLVIGLPGGHELSVPYSLSAASRPSSPLVQLGSAAAGASYAHEAITFEASGGLFPGHSAIEVTQRGAVFEAGQGQTSGWSVYDDTTGLVTGAGATYGPNGVASVVPGSGEGFRVAAGDLVTVDANGTTEPSTPGEHVIDLWTSGDRLAVAASYRLVSPVAPAGAVVSLVPSGSGVSLALTFRSAGGLAVGWSTIELNVPGLRWPAAGGFGVYDDTTGASAGAVAGIDGQPFGAQSSDRGPASIQIGLGPGFLPGPGDVLTVLVMPLGRPAPAAGEHVTLSTSADPLAAGVPLSLVR